MSELPARLEREGLERGQRTLIIWEGVTMYLTPEAIEASVSAIHALGSAGSVLAMTYFDVTHVKQPSPLGRVAAAVVARAGEPWKFGWVPAELGAWLARRGFSLQRDESDRDLARRWLGGRYGRLLQGRGHVAVAETR
jgi:methyltransferase (TIGR00027 family)